MSQPWPGGLVGWNIGLCTKKVLGLIPSGGVHRRQLIDIFLSLLSLKSINVSFDEDKK